MNNQQMRDEWKAAGGSIHGPNVETVCMPESEYFKFRKSLITQDEPVQPKNENRHIHADILEAIIQDPFLQIQRWVTPAKGQPYWSDCQSSGVLQSPGWNYRVKPESGAYGKHLHDQPDQSPAQPVQPAVAQGEPVAITKLVGQFPGTLHIQPLVDLEPNVKLYTEAPTVAINEQLLGALRLIRGKHVCGALTLPEADLERTNAAIAAAEAEKAKGGV